MKKREICTCYDRGTLIYDAQQGCADNKGGKSELIQRISHLMLWRAGENNLEQPILSIPINGLMVTLTGSFTIIEC